jgi:hypothetical protein
MRYDFEDDFEDDPRRDTPKLDTILAAPSPWDDTAWTLPPGFVAHDLAALRAAHKARGLTPAQAYNVLMQDSDTDLLDVLRRVHEHGALKEHERFLKVIGEL